jgi:hypothetical protein
VYSHDVVTEEAREVSNAPRLQSMFVKPRQYLTTNVLQHTKHADNVEGEYFVLTKKGRSVIDLARANISKHELQEELWQHLDAFVIL